MNENQAPIACDKCEGRGWYEDAAENKYGEWEQIQVQCYACRSTGYKLIFPSDNGATDDELVKEVVHLIKNPPHEIYVDSMAMNLEGEITQKKTCTRVNHEENAKAIIKLIRNRPVKAEKWEEIATSELNNFIDACKIIMFYAEGGNDGGKKADDFLKNEDRPVKAGDDNEYSPPCPDISEIRKIAREHGYAVGVHGSLKRDFDIIAAPWTENAIAYNLLIEKLCEGLNAIVIGPIEGKPLGRRAVTLQIKDRWLKHIDLSIMPKSLPLPAHSEGWQKIEYYKGGEALFYQPDVESRMGAKARMLIENYAPYPRKTTHFMNLPNPPKGE